LLKVVSSGSASFSHGRAYFLKGSSCVKVTSGEKKDREKREEEWQKRVDSSLDLVRTRQLEGGTQKGIEEKAL